MSRASYGKFTAIWRESIPVDASTTSSRISTIVTQAATATAIDTSTRSLSRMPHMHAGCCRCTTLPMQRVRAHCWAA
eukprot:3932196-Rhodomonas_salina.1